MQDLKTVLIAILASSTKNGYLLFDELGHKRVLDHTIANCQSAKFYSNKFTPRKSYEVKTALVVPEGDAIVDSFSTHELTIIEVPPYLDDLSKLAAVFKDDDYLCFVKGPCAFLPAFIISKLISIALMNGYDYLSNYDDDHKILPHGLECEVIGRRLFDWVNETSRLEEDRRCVTGLLRRAPPRWAKMGITIGHFDLADGRSYYVGDEESLDMIREEYERIGRALHAAEGKYGRNFIHRL